MAIEIDKGRRVTKITTSTTTVVKDTKGRLRKLIVYDGGTGWTIDVYDGAADNANLVWQYLTADGKVALDVDCPMTTSIRVVTTGATPGVAQVVWS